MAELSVAPAAECSALNGPPPATAARSVEALDRYAAAAIAGELRRLAAAGPGTRNNTLFTVAVALGQLVGAGLLDHHHAHQTLQEAASAHVAAGAYSPADDRQRPPPRRSSAPPTPYRGRIVSGATREDRDRAGAVAEAAWRFLLNRHRLAQTTPSADSVELHRVARQLATGDALSPIEVPHPERRA